MLKGAFEVLQWGVKELKAFPGAQAAVFDRGRIFTLCFGTLDENEKNDVIEQTLYDLASLAKPIATATAIALLMQQGKIGFGDTLAQWLPTWEKTPFASCTIEQLLSHTAGFEPVMEMYNSVPVNFSGKEQAKKTMSADLLLSKPICNLGKKEVYSDLDFFLLGMIIEKASGQSLGAFVEKKILDALGMENTLYNPLKRFGTDNIAPTGFCPWRKRVLRGEVNDSNTFAWGGVSGQAGLFGTALDLMNVVIEIIDGLEGDGILFSPDLLELFCLRPFESIEGSFALGWDTVSTTGTLTGKHFSNQTIGHHGFTGTSLWIDYQAKVGIALLTNRVHFTGDKRKINILRPLFFDAVWEDLGKV